jgi:hypothetical protein
MTGAHIFLKTSRAELYGNRLVDCSAHLSADEKSSAVIRGIPRRYTSFRAEFILPINIDFQTPWNVLFTPTHVSYPNLHVRPMTTSWAPQRPSFGQIKVSGYVYIVRFLIWFGWVSITDPAIARALNLWCVIRPPSARSRPLCSF